VGDLNEAAKLGRDADAGGGQYIKAPGIEGKNAASAREAIKSSSKGEELRKGGKEGQFSRKKENRLKARSGTDLVAKGRGSLQMKKKEPCLKILPGLEGK